MKLHPPDTVIQYRRCDMKIGDIWGHCTCFVSDAHKAIRPSNSDSAAMCIDSKTQGAVVIPCSSSDLVISTYQPGIARMVAVLIRMHNPLPPAKPCDSGTTFILTAACSHELHDTFSKEQCLQKRSNGAGHAALHPNGHAASSGY